MLAISILSITVVLPVLLRFDHINRLGKLLLRYQLRSKHEIIWAGGSRGPRSPVMQRALVHCVLTRARDTTIIAQMHHAHSSFFLIDYTQLQLQLESVSHSFRQILAADCGAVSVARVVSLLMCCAFSRCTLFSKCMFCHSTEQIAELAAHHRVIKCVITADTE